MGKLQINESKAIYKIGIITSKSEDETPIYSVTVGGIPYNNLTAHYHCGSDLTTHGNPFVADDSVIVYFDAEIPQYIIGYENAPHDCESCNAPLIITLSTGAKEKYFPQTKIFEEFIAESWEGNTCIGYTNVSGGYKIYYGCVDTFGYNPDNIYLELTDSSTGESIGDTLSRNIVDLGNIADYGDCNSAILDYIPPSGASCGGGYGYDYYFPFLEDDSPQDLEISYHKFSVSGSGELNYTNDWLVSNQGFDWVNENISENFILSSSGVYIMNFRVSELNGFPYPINAPLTWGSGTGGQNCTAKLNLEYIYTNNSVFMDSSDVENGILQIHGTSFFNNYSYVYGTSFSDFYPSDYPKMSSLYLTEKDVLINLSHKSTWGITTDTSGLDAYVDSFGQVRACNAGSFENIYTEFNFFTIKPDFDIYNYDISYTKTRTESIALCQNFNCIELEETSSSNPTDEWLLNFEGTYPYYPFIFELKDTTFFTAFLINGTLYAYNGCVVTDGITLTRDTEFEAHYAGLTINSINFYEPV